MRLSNEQSEIRTACASDPWAFARVVKTQDPQSDDPIRPFPQYPYLKRFFQALTSYARVAVRKSRQMLYTWAACVYAIWLAGFHPHKEILIQSQKEEKSKHLIIRMAFIIRHLPAYLLPSKPKITSGQIVFEFPNGEESRVWSVPQGPDQVATYSPSVVIMDEMALQEYAYEAYHGAIPALREGGQFVGISSPRAEAFFTRFCKIDGVHTLTTHYSDHPEFQKQAKELGGWKEWKRAKMREWGWEDEAMWEREMEINENIGEGVPAFKPPYSRETHVCEAGIAPNPALPIQRGWDFGTFHPACVWTQVAANGQWLILREHVATNIPMRDFIDQVVELSRELAPIPTPETFQDFCDPDGFSKTKGDTGPSCVDLLYDRNIFPLNGRSKVGLRESIETIVENLRIQRIDGVLRPGTLIDPSCRNILAGLDGGYVKTDSTTGRIRKRRGTKIENAMDALRYIAAGAFMLSGRMPKKERVAVA